MSRIECDLQHGEVICILGQREYLGVAMEERWRRIEVMGWWKYLRLVRVLVL